MNAEHTCTVSKRVEFAKLACKISHNHKDFLLLLGVMIQWTTVTVITPQLVLSPDARGDLRLKRRGSKPRSLAGLWMWAGGRGVAGPRAHRSLARSLGQGFSSVNDQSRPLREWPVTDRLRTCSPTSWSISRRTRMCLRSIKVKNQFSFESNGWNFAW